MTWRVQFDWFADFCGLEDDREALKFFLLATHLKLSAHLTVLQDEEAPVSVPKSTAVVVGYTSVFINPLPLLGYMSVFINPLPLLGYA